MAAPNIIKYKHHGKQMSVREDLKGKHTEHCLCYRCKKIIPSHPLSNCQTANKLFHFDEIHGITTPVWECEDYTPYKIGYLSS